MKYLTSFYESKQNDIETFCRMYLIDLIDNGWNIRIELDGRVKYKPDLEGNRWSFIDSYKFNAFNIELPNWGNIKDSFIPFIEMLINEYDIEGDIEFKGRYSNLTKSYSVDELLSGCDLEDDYRIIRIVFYIH